tara:strand:- start:627 stop:938 length:312 start_codon:yes stop_codon:yes gene_type:complete
MFGKGMNMVKQAQQMQKKMAQIQQELDEMRIEGTSGGGMVKAVVNGKKDLVSININPDILTEDAEMVEDLVLAAIKEASSNADSISQDKMGALTGGMKIPGLF